MRANRTQNIIKKEFKSTYSYTINNSGSLNYKDLLKKDNQETKSIVEEEIKYPKRYQLKSNKGKPLFSTEENKYGKSLIYTQNRNYLRDLDKGLGHNNQYFNEFKKSFDMDNKYNQRSGLTLKSSPKINLNNIYNNENEKINDNRRTIERNLDKSFQGRKNNTLNSNNINYDISKNIYYSNRNNSKKEEKRSDSIPKYLTNNLYINRGVNQKSKSFINYRKGRPMLVAQKICNIVIKGKKRKNNKIKKKKEKTKKKVKKEKIPNSSITLKNKQLNLSIKDNANEQLDTKLKNGSNTKEYENKEDLEEKEEVFQIKHNENENDEEFEKIQDEKDLYHNEEYDNEEIHDNIEQEYEQEDNNEENVLEEYDDEKQKRELLKKVNKSKKEFNINQEKDKNKISITKIQKIENKNELLKYGKLLKINNVKKIPNNRDIKSDKLNKSNDIIKIIES